MRPTPPRAWRRSPTCRAALRLAAGGLVAALVVACSNSGTAAPTTAPGTTAAPASSVTSPASTTQPRDDRVLRIGVMVPLTGPAAAIGTSLKAAVDLAVQRADAAGGVLGRPIEVHTVDEGSDLGTATSALDDLVKEGVDAIIGPSSSTDALSLLGTVRRAQIAACSPTASAASLDRFPDDGLFVRTVPSDSLQAEAIARAIELTGRGDVAVLSIDDAYGRPFADAVVAALRRRSISVVGSARFQPSGSGDVSQVVRSAVSNAKVVAVIGDAATGPVAVTAALEATAGTDVRVVVNDAMRGQPAASAFASLAPTELARIEGVGPRAVPDDADFLAALRTVSPDASGLYATNAVDCLDLIALAAESADSTRPRDIANGFVGVANGGTRCVGFADCVADLHRGLNIDDDGPSGQLQLGADGDIDRGSFDLWGIQPSGAEQMLGVVTVTG
jgi:branched-chain amino acid transport system substrate-binding protein